MDTMKRLQILEPGRAVWRDAPVPQPAEGEALVKVLGVTTCPHWDLHLMEGVPMFPGQALSYPYTPGQPGHEAMGEVVACGHGVTAPAVGTRVAAWRDPGHQQPGCYAQYVALSVDNLIEVPEDLTPQAIAPLELAMCVQVSFDQLVKLDAVRVRRFGVSGLGPAGLVAVQVAKAYGARHVVGIDPLPGRRALARQLGADEVLAPGRDAFPPGRAGPHALDAAIDCTGLKVSIEFLMDRTREAVAIFGVLREDVTFGARHWSHLTLMGYGSHNRQAAGRALQWVQSGKLSLAPLVTHTLPFSHYDEGIALLRGREAIKICFLPWADEPPS
jgi:threonine dehydrogenase-like Zn-dependent dehydrogenase